MRFTSAGSRRSPRSRSSSARYSAVMAALRSIKWWPMSARSPWCAGHDQLLSSQIAHATSNSGSRKRPSASRHSARTRFESICRLRFAGRSYPSREPARENSRYNVAGSPGTSVRALASALATSSETRPFPITSRTSSHAARSDAGGKGSDDDVSSSARSIEEGSCLPSMVPLSSFIGQCQEAAPDRLVGELGPPVLVNDALVVEAPGTAEGPPDLLRGAEVVVQPDGEAAGPVPVHEQVADDRVEQLGLVALRPAGPVRVAPAGDRASPDLGDDQRFVPLAEGVQMLGDSVQLLRDFVQTAEVPAGVAVDRYDVR